MQFPPFPPSTPFDSCRRGFLKTLGLAVAGSALPARAASPPSVSFFLVGDTHFLADKTQTDRMEERSARCNGALVDMLNRLPGSAFPEEVGGGTVPAPQGVLHVGDVIDSGDKSGVLHEAMQRTEWAAFEAEYGLTGKEGRLKYPVFEITGNHDSPHGSGHAVEQMVRRQRMRSGLTALSKNGRHAAWQWGGVQFVTLGLVVGTDLGVDRKRRYEAGDSLSFLHEVLAHTAKDQPLVLLHHVDVARYTVANPGIDHARLEWDPADVAAFYSAIRGRRAALFHGHTHFRNVFRWDGVSTSAAEGVAVFNVDNSAHFSGLAQAFFHVEIHGTGLTVREYATSDAWQTGAWTRQVWRVSV